MDSTQQEKTEQMGSLAGLGAGILTGARVGTVLIPVPFVGTFVGGFLGGVLGSAVGQRLGTAALSGVNAFFDGLSGPPQPPAKNRIKPIPVDDGGETTEV